MTRTIRFLGGASTAGKQYGRGDELAGKEKDLKPLVDSGSAEWADEEHEPGELAGVDFASDEAAELAASVGLVAEDFTEGPSGKTGYTVADVRRAARED